MGLPMENSFKTNPLITIPAISLDNFEFFFKFNPNNKRIHLKTTKSPKFGKRRVTDTFYSIINPNFFFKLQKSVNNLK